MDLSLIFLLVGCAYIQIVRKDYTESLRDKIVIFCLGYFPVSLVLMNFNRLFPIIFSLNSILVLLNCFVVVLLLSLSCSKIMGSSPHKRIFYFWLYLLICSFWSEAWLPILSGKLTACLVFFGGLALGHQIMLRNKLNLALKLLTCSGLFVIFAFYIFVLPKLAGHNIIENMGWMRIGSRDFLNPNSIAMVLLPFTLVGLIQMFTSLEVVGGKVAFRWFFAGGVLCLLACWLIVRSGSRTGFLSLCAGAIVVFSFKARSWQSRIVLSAFFALVLALVVVYNSTGLRVLSFGPGGGGVLADGRFSEWGAGISSMSVLQMIFGAGGIVRHGLDGLIWGRFLSIYVTIYQASGIVGCLLFAGFIFSVVRQVLRIGKSTMPAACFTIAALVYGVGESGPISPFNIQCLFFGVGVGLLPLQSR